MRRIIFCFSLFLFSNALRSQNFNYTVSADSVSWQALNSQTLLNSSSTGFNQSYKVPLGFTFNFLGRDFDSLTIEKSGLIEFDSNRQFCFWGLIGYSDTQDSLGNISAIGYELSGQTGNRKLTIQFTNVATPDQPRGLVSYQICFHENKSIEFIMGTYSLSGLSAPSVSTPIVIGLINQNMDTPTRALTLSNSPNTSLAILVDDTNPDLSYLSGLPSTGIRFVFNAAY